DRRRHILIGLLAYLRNRRAPAIERRDEIRGGRHGGLGGQRGARRILIGRQRALQIGEHGRRRRAVLVGARSRGGRRAVVDGLGERRKPGGYRLLRRCLRSGARDLLQERGVGLASHRSDVRASEGIRDEVRDLGRIAGRVGVGYVVGDDGGLRRIGRKGRGYDVERGREAHRGLLSFFRSSRACLRWLWCWRRRQSALRWPQTRSL